MSGSSSSSKETRRTPKALTLVVAWRKGKGYDFGRVKTAQEFTDRLHRIVEKADAHVTSSEESAYAIGDDLDEGEIMIFPLQEKNGSREGQTTPQRKALFPKQPSARTDDPLEFRRRLISFGDMDPVGIAFLKEHKPTFYALLHGNTAQERVAYLRHANPMELVKPGNILARLGDTLTALDDEVFLMDDRVDLVLRPSRIEIINKKFFDQMFFDPIGSYEDLDGMVRNALGVLPMVGETLNQLVERTREKRRSRYKLLEIQDSGHLATVTMAQFKAALKLEGYEYRRFIRRDTKGQETIYAEDDDLDLLLYILNEDLFRGGLTGRRLAASKKRAIQ